MERAVGIIVDDLAALYVLDSLSGFGPQKFKELHAARLRPTDVVSGVSILPTVGKRGDVLRTQVRQVSSEVRKGCIARAIRQIEAACRCGATIVTYDHPAYPPNLYASNYPVPVLYARGAVGVLAKRNAVACVGSRGIRPPYVGLHNAFAATACSHQFTVVSGFALGADAVGHRAAHQSHGLTICVMPGGLDRPFPPENRALWHELLGYAGAVFVSEFAFGTSASALTLRKRNKGIAGISRGVLVSQSSATGGAMNAYRFALEQRKPVATFAADGRDDTSGNAVITHRQCGPTFSASHPDEEGFRRWLQTLSSLI